MENKETDYFFYINWESAEKKSYRIGLLAQIDNIYYLKLNSKENSASAYDQGCIGIPGFQNERVYRSEELFDFFKRRILKKNSQNLCEELRQTSARSMIDSFSIETIPEELQERFKKIVLDMFKNQEEMDKIAVESTTPVVEC